MTLYKYRAVDSEGAPVEDTMEAASAHQATRRLQERGLTVNSIEELHAPGLMRVSHRLTWEELELFTQQLLAITRSELPLAPSLRSLAEDLRNPRLRPVLDNMHRDLERGASLEEAIEKNHQAFPRLFVSAVRAGEATGNLPAVLQLLASYASRMSGLKQTFQVAMAYPLMVAVLALLVMGYMLQKVVPTFAEIFQDFGAQLPAPTMFWIGISELTRYHWPEMVMAVAAIGIAFGVARAWLRRKEGGRAWLDSLRLHTPGLGHIHYQASLARFSHTLGLLLSARAPVLESLELAGAASGSPHLQRAVDESTVQVAGGEKIADALSATGFFPYDFCWLLLMGESRGKPEESLESLATTYERKAQTHERLIGSLAGPAFIVILALIVLSIVVSLYLPIFTLGDAISGA